MKKAAEAAVIAVVVVIAAGGGYLAYGELNLRTAQPTSEVTLPTIGYSRSTFSTCSGYPPGGDCVAPYNYTFTVQVNYSGPWRLSYSGQTNVGEANAHYVTGNLTGNGYYSVAVNLVGLNNRWLDLCAQAQKLDGSDSVLVLTVTGFNMTSVPYGSVSYCGGVVP